MSRAYQIGYEAVCSDNGTFKIDFLPILGKEGKEEMKNILREELKKKGWSETKDGELETHKDGATIRLSKDGDMVEISMQIKKKESVTSDTDYKNKEKEIVEKAKAASEEKLKKELVKKLIKVEEDVKVSLDDAINKTLVEALKRKAASMGNIESITEGRDSNGNPETVIKVLL